MRRHTCSLVTRRSTRARQAQAASGAHAGQSAPKTPSNLVLTGACQIGHGVGGFTTNFIHSKTPSKRATRLATGPRSAWTARWQVGREHCLSRNATKRHDLTIFASHFRDRVHLQKKLPIGARLISTRRRPPRTFYHISARGPEIKNLDRGCRPAIRRSARWRAEEGGGSH